MSWLSSRSGRPELVLPQLRVDNSEGRANHPSSPSQPSAPATLSSYLSSCLRLSLNRDCSPSPVLATRPADSPAEEAPRPAFTPAAFVNRAGKGVSNADRAGLSPKKAHEVVNLATLAGDVLADGRVRHAVDVGSGRVSQSQAGGVGFVVMGGRRRGPDPSWTMHADTRRLLVIVRLTSPGPWRDRRWTCTCWR